jgi:hypothetical protein
VLHPTDTFLSFLLFAGLPVSAASANYIQQIVERTKSKRKSKRKDSLLLEGKILQYIFSIIYLKTSLYKAFVV